MNGVVREKNRLEHLRRGDAIHRDTGLDHVVERSAHLDGDQCANADFGKALGGLNDDFDVFALLVDVAEDFQIADLREHAPDLRLENDENRDDEECRDAAEHPAKDGQFEQRGDEREGENERKKAGDDGGSAGATHEREHVVDGDGEQENFQRRSPDELEEIEHQRRSFGAPARGGCSVFSASIMLR